MTTPTPIEIAKKWAKEAQVHAVSIEQYLHCVQSAITEALAPVEKERDSMLPKNLKATLEQLTAENSELKKAKEHVELAAVNLIGSYESIGGNPKSAFITTLRAAMKGTEQ